MAFTRRKLAAGHVLSPVPTETGTGTRTDSGTETAAAVAMIRAPVTTRFDALETTPSLVTSAASVAADLSAASSSPPAQPPEADRPGLTARTTRAVASRRSSLRTAAASTASGVAFGTAQAVGAATAATTPAVEASPPRSTRATAAAAATARTTAMPPRVTAPPRRASPHTRSRRSVDVAQAADFGITDETTPRVPSPLAIPLSGPSEPRADPLAHDHDFAASLPRTSSAELPVITPPSASTGAGPAGSVGQDALVAATGHGDTDADVGAGANATAVAAAAAGADAEARSPTMATTPVASDGRHHSPTSPPEPQEPGLASTASGALTPTPTLPRRGRRRRVADPDLPVRKSTRPRTDIDYKNVENGDSAFKYRWTRVLAQREGQWGADDFLRVRGDACTVAWLAQTGFARPVVVPEPAGLDMAMPPADLTPHDVARAVGPAVHVQVLEVTTQQASTMNLASFADYYAQPASERTQLLNVITLEIEETALGAMVRRPRVVRDLDWTAQHWPPFLHAHRHYPRVRVYCLMSVADAFTDFHLDFGGSSVFYHLLSGEKIFYLVEPTPRNLRRYEKWSNSDDQSRTFFGDVVGMPQVHRVHLSAGNTMLIPGGWIHAVFTPCNTMVIGGNFLQSYGIEQQWAVQELETRSKMHSKFRFPMWEALQWYVARDCASRLRAEQDQFMKQGRLYKASEASGSPGSSWVMPAPSLDRAMLHRFEMHTQALMRVLLKANAAPHLTLADVGVPASIADPARLVTTLARRLARARQFWRWHDEQRAVVDTALKSAPSAPTPTSKTTSVSWADYEEDPSDDSDPEHDAHLAFLSPVAAPALDVPAALSVSDPSAALAPATASAAVATAIIASANRATDPTAAARKQEAVERALQSTAYSARLVLDLPDVASTLGPVQKVGARASAAARASARIGSGPASTTDSSAPISATVKAAPPASAATSATVSSANKTPAAAPMPHQPIRSQQSLPPVIPNHSRSVQGPATATPVSPLAPTPSSVAVSFDPTSHHVSSAEF